MEWSTGGIHWVAERSLLHLPQKNWASTALAVAVIGTPRWWPMAGWLHGVILWWEECMDSHGEDGKVAYLCSSRHVVDVWDSPTLLSSLPLSQGLCQVQLSGEEQAGGMCLLPAMS